MRLALDAEVDPTVEVIVGEGFEVFDTARPFRTDPDGQPDGLVVVVAGVVHSVALAAGQEDHLDAAVRVELLGEQTRGVGRVHVLDHLGDVLLELGLLGLVVGGSEDEAPDEGDRDDGQDDLHGLIHGICLLGWLVMLN